MTALIPFLVLALGFCFISYRRALRYLQIFQQNSYTPSDFLRWICSEKAFDRKASLTILIISLLGVATGLSLTASIIGTIALSLLAVLEPDPRKKGKVTLKMTERVTEVFSVMLGTYFLALLLLCYLNQDTPLYWLVLIVLFQSLPLFLIFANFLLSPFEKRKQLQYARQAQEILAKVSPFVIGITGSFGKTSTKDVLGRILQVSLGATFWPPKSINSPMGITREIRERLQEGYKYAVIEMGAYYVGSIKKNCDLWHPKAAIITGVGHVHLDRFGSFENVYLAKSELARALPHEGILVCNGDNDKARKMAEEFRKKDTLLYGFEKDKGHLDAWISSWKMGAQGTEFTIEWQGQRYQGQTLLWGRTTLLNILGAFTMAAALGASPDLVLAVIRNLEPVDNRLQVKKDGDITYIHDAYNSNPTGFAAALEVFKALPGKRRILMTPGMIELGSLQYEDNKRIGKLASECCDLALIVGKTNQEALVEGLKAGGFTASNIQLCPSRNYAFEFLRTNKQPGDVILIENDLTDIYEHAIKF